MHLMFYLQNDRHSIMDYISTDKQIILHLTDTLKFPVMTLSYPLAHLLTVLEVQINRQEHSCTRLVITLACYMEDQHQKPETPFQLINVKKTANQTTSV